AAVLGGVLGGTAHQFPGRPAQQPPDVYLPGARPTEEPGEEFSEGVRAVALRTCEPAGHGDPFRRLAGSPLGRAEPGPKDPGARSLLDVPVRTRVPGRVPVTHGAAVSCVSIGRPGPLVRSTPGSRGPARPGRQTLGRPPRHLRTIAPGRHPGRAGPRPGPQLRPRRAGRPARLGIAGGRRGTG